jgi:hypothetical protein
MSSLEKVIIKRWTALITSLFQAIGQTFPGISHLGVIIKGQHVTFPSKIILTFFEYHRTMPRSKLLAK